jgi:hypothetical protein
MTSSSDFAFRRLDDEVVLMNLRTNKIFALNRTGARVWELLQSGHDWPGVRSVLLEEFDVEPEALDRELETLAESLAAEGFGHEGVADPPRGPSPRDLRGQQQSRGRSAPRMAGVTTAWLLLRMGAWSLVLPVLKRLVSLPTLVRLMCREPAGRRSDEDERRIVRSAGRIYRLRRPGSCLERSLLAYRYLSSASSDPHLVIGVRREERDVIGHAWVLVDGSPVYESSVALESFVPVVAFASDGSATTTVDSLPRP